MAELLAAQESLNGELLDDKYRMEQLLGAGGMGAVYRATHAGTKRTVAIKVIHPQFSSNQEFVERFKREAEATGRLRHPNVVDVTDFGFARIGSNQVAYLVMEYLDGCTLAEVLAEEGRLPVVWAVDILEQVCSAVDEAHRAGIIHRDLKPDNIWLEPNRRGGYTVKVLDFGLVRLEVPPAPGHKASSTPRIEASPVKKPTEAADTEGDTLILSQTREAPEAGSSGETSDTIELTRIGSVMGTPSYMSPEQWRGARLDARSDIYSLGVLAYRMLAGVTPFTGTVVELSEQHKTNDPPPLRKKSSRVPKRMARVVMKALAKDPSERPESAAGFASALRAGAEGSGTLLRRAIALYGEHLPVFLKISLLAYAPLIAVIGFLILDESFNILANVPPAYMIIIGPLLFLLMIVASLLAYFVVSAVTVPVVIQLMVAPLRPVLLKTAWAALSRRWWRFVAASFVVTMLILLGTALFIIPGVIIAVCYVLYAPVVVMEGTGLRATLKRARKLMQRSWSTVIVITVLQFTLPVLVWFASVNAQFHLKLGDDYLPKEFGFNFSISSTSALYQLLNIFITPLTAIMTALLYLKTRRAGGESLQDAAQQFDSLEIPRSNWQARMRSRASTHAPSGRS